MTAANTAHLSAEKLTIAYLLLTAYNVLLMRLVKSSAVAWCGIDLLLRPFHCGLFRMTMHCGMLTDAMPTGPGLSMPSGYHRE